MADTKITELPAIPDADVFSTTVLPVVDSVDNTTKKAQVGQLANGLFSTIPLPGSFGSATYAPVITVDSKGRITAISQTAITAGSAVTGVFNVRNYGAVGNGDFNTGDPDTVGINLALAACLAFNATKGGGGTLYFPSGVYCITSAISITDATTNITVLGDGPKTSIIKSAAGVACLNFSFLQVGQEQPYAPTIANMGFQCAGAGPTDHGALWFTYTIPPATATTSHRSSGPTITNCEIRSIDNTKYWPIGIEITSAANTRIVDTFVSGYADGNWNNLKGVGIFFHKSCVNSEITDTQVNFFKRGFKFDATEVPSQGLCITDCIFVGVNTAGYFDSVTGLSYRLGGINWTGGVIDVRITGTTGNRYAIYATYVDDIKITGVKFAADSNTLSLYGVYLNNCRDALITGNSFLGYNGVGVVTTDGTCETISVLGNQFSGSSPQLWLSSGTTKSLYRSTTLNSQYAPSGPTTDAIVDSGTNNIVESSLKGVATTVWLNANQSVAVGAEPEVVWTTALVPSQFGIWSSSVNPSHLTVPTGARKVKLTANIRWATGASGTRIIKIKAHPAAGGVDEVFAASQTFTAGSGSDVGDDSISTGVIPVCYSDGTPLYSYFVVTASFVGGASPIDIRGVFGTNFSIEVVA